MEEQVLLWGSGHAWRCLLAVRDQFVQRIAGVGGSVSLSHIVEGVFTSPFVRAKTWTPRPRLEQRIRLSSPQAHAIVALAIGQAPADEAYDRDGVDRSLIRWMLGLTPSQRLAHVQGTIDLVGSVRRVPDGNR